MNEIYGLTNQQVVAGYEHGRIAAQQAFATQGGAGTPTSTNTVSGLISLAHDDVDSLFREIAGLEATIGGVLAMPVPKDDGGVTEQTSDSTAVVRLRELRTRIQIARGLIDAIAQRAQV